MNIHKKEKVLLVRLDKQLYDWVKNLANERRTSMGALTRQALLQTFDFGGNSKKKKK